jgi:hypothetical protein
MGDRKAVGCDVGSGARVGAIGAADVAVVADVVGCIVGFGIWMGLATAVEATGDAPSAIVGCSTEGLGD